MSSEWVYEKLVTNDKDAVGLIAYAFYKAEKHSSAKELREAGHDEAAIKEKLKQFHDTTLVSPKRLSSYREQAQIYLTSIKDGLESNIGQKNTQLSKDLQASKNKIDELELSLKELKKTHKKNIKEAYAKVIAAAESVQKKGIIQRFLDWTLNGFDGIWAATLLAIAIMGIVMLKTPENERGTIVRDFVVGLLSTNAKPPVSSASEKQPDVGDNQASQ